MGWTLRGGSMGQFLAQYRHRFLCSPTPPLLHPSPTIAGRRRCGSHIEVGLNPHVGFAQGYEGRDM
jgi:hypothetical protein